MPGREGQPQGDIPSREERDSTWCVWCCHSHPSGERCGAAYIYVPEIGHDECGCTATHHDVERRKP